MDYICLNCRHVWNYKGKTEPQQCGKCRSYDIMLLSVFNDIKDKCASVDEENPLLRLSILKVIIEHEGLRLRPISTLNLAESILSDLFQEVPVGAAITENGTIYYQKKLVKKKKKSKDSADISVV